LCYVLLGSRAKPLINSTKTSPENPSRPKPQFSRQSVCHGYVPQSGRRAGSTENWVQKFANKNHAKTQFEYCTCSPEGADDRGACPWHTLCREARGFALCRHQLLESMYRHRPHKLYIGPAGVNEPRLWASPTSMAVLASSVRSQPEKNTSQ
jgi:hypothetical protein